MPTGPVVMGKPMEINFVWENGCKALTDWCGSISKFCSALKAPHQPLGKGVVSCKHEDWKPALQQLLIIHFWTAALFAPGLLVFLLVGILGGGFSMILIMLCIQGVIIAFFITWFVWYSLSERSPGCCCCIIATLEHPLVGLLWGAVMLAQGVQLIIRSTGFLNALFGFTGTLLFIGNCVYSVVCIWCGIAAIRVGMAASGIEVPSKMAVGVGNAEEKPVEEKPAPEV